MLLCPSHSILHRFYNAGENNTASLSVTLAFLRLLSSDRPLRKESFTTYIHIIVDLYKANFSKADHLFCIIATEFSRLGGDIYEEKKLV